MQAYAKDGRTQMTDNPLRDSRLRADEVQRQLTIINDVIFASDVESVSTDTGRWVVLSVRYK